MKTNTLSATTHTPTKESDPRGRRQDLGALDLFRLIAAILVIAIHTSPLNEINPTADLFLTGVAARVAVPFFFAVSGYFADFSTASGLKKIVVRTALNYLIATIVFLPVRAYYNFYFTEILFEGVFYHFWYFPACIMGALVVYMLKKLPMPAAFSIAGILYIIGVLGESYYNLVSDIEPFRTLYILLYKILPSTRDGFFISPLFLLYGNALSNSPRPARRGYDIFGLIVSVALLTAERFLLRDITVGPHDNLYFSLIPSTIFLMRLLTSIKAKPRPFLRPFSMWIYILHPLIIHYLAKSEIGNSLLFAVIVVIVTLPSALICAAVMTKLKAVLKKPGIGSA